MIGGTIARRNGESILLYYLPQRSLPKSFLLGWPWQVAIVEKEKTVCGGVLISSNQVLTRLIDKLYLT